MLRDWLQEYQVFEVLLELACVLHVAFWMYVLMILVLL